MIRKIVYSAVVAFTVLTLCGSGGAAAQERKNYVAIKAGFVTFTDRLDIANLETGFDGEFVYGRYLSPNLSIEAGSGYFHDGVNKGYGNEVKGIPFTLTVKGIYPLRGWELFGGGGVGLYSAKFHGLVNGTVTDAWDTVFGGHVVAGANIDLFYRFFAGLEGKYLATERADFRLFTSRLSSYSLRASLGFRF
ncbi:MAG: porin family protein [Candidatus Dadabacteria bacterium]|nr:MAG: porin family protein [Candidatus Dadabacteria bacterium]